MLILAIETTGPRASAALIDSAGALTEKISPDEMNHLKGLTLLIGELLGERGVGMGDVSHIAASEGPGSFTGIRIGVSTARALAQARGIETIGVPTLEAFAYNREGYGGIVCPVFDARRGQVYSGAFVLGALGRPECVLEGKAWAPEELFGELGRLAAGPACGAAGVRTEANGLVAAAGNAAGTAHETPASGKPGEGCETGAAGAAGLDITFFGDGIGICEGLISGLRGQAGRTARIEAAEPGCRFQRAGSVARLASVMLEEGRAKPFGELLPVYMRKAEAERKLEERLAAEKAAAMAAEGAGG
jgi:tRNA threonylcarbamoyladenosine biosynthesis protein TsaB